MVKTIDSLPWLSAIGVALGVVFLVVAVYGVTRLVLRRRTNKDADRSIDSVIENIMIIHVLVMTLVFAQEQINVVDLRHTTAVEAA